MIGAVSPAARQTCRMTPVRMPLIELGSTTCADGLPAAWRRRSSRPRGTTCGTDASASLVLAMITGRVMIARVSEAARIELPKRGEQDERAQPEQGVDDARHAGQVDHGQVDRRG